MRIKKPEILVINQYYVPDVASTGLLAHDICSGLTKQGCNVSVVTAQPNYVSGLEKTSEFEVLDGVRVHRLDLGSKTGRENKMVRIKGYLRFLKKAWNCANVLCRTHRYDFVLTFHNPPFVGLIGRKLARSHGLKFVYAPLDIHPDILIETNWMNIPKPFVWLWDKMNHKMLSGADTIIALSENMKQTLVNEKRADMEKVSVIPIWARPEIGTNYCNKEIRKELNISEDDLMILYAGNIGIMHPINPILDSAKLVQDLPVKIIFMGDGANRKHLENRIAKENINNVIYIPYQPEDRFCDIVRSSDVCIVSLKKGMEKFAFPSRAMTFLSAGKPLITMMNEDCDFVQLMKENECGWNVNDYQELTELIRKCSGKRFGLLQNSQNAVRVYYKYFRKETILEKYFDIFCEGRNQSAVVNLETDYIKQAA